MLRAHFSSIAATTFFLLASDCAPTAVVHARSENVPVRASAVPVTEVPVRTETLEEVGLDSSLMDRSVKPCDDFYQFACGAWLKRTSLPDEQSVWTRSFSEMAKTIENNSKTMLEGFANPPAGTVLDPKQKMLGGFYASCMDETTVEALGTRPIDDLMVRLALRRDPLGLSRPWVAAPEAAWVPGTLQRPSRSWRR